MLRIRSKVQEGDYPLNASLVTKILKIQCLPLKEIITPAALIDSSIVPALPTFAKEFEATVAYNQDE